MAQGSRYQEEKFFGQSLNEGNLIKMMIMEGDLDEGHGCGDHDDGGVRDVKDEMIDGHESASSSSLNGSTLSKDSSDEYDDASSPEVSSRSGEDMYDLSELMAQLPIKRGLSKFYQGKSESFTSLARVTSIEDLAKKASPYRRRKLIKACKSYAGGLSNQRSLRSSPYVMPKPTIAKRGTRSSLLLSMSCLRGKSNFLNTCKPPVSPPVQSSF